MNLVAAKQVALDNSLVPLEKRLKIEKCNARIEFSKTQKEETYQVTLDALKLSPCYPAFLITTEICLILPNQECVEPPSEDELVPFIQELGYSGKCDMLSAIHTNQMHQPWQTFAAIINRYISGKPTRLNRLIESRAQILWGMYNKMNVDFVALLREDIIIQADNREISLAREEHMPYPRFNKVIINHFISKDKTISIRNKINLYTYGALIHDEMINQVIKDSKAYKTYLDFATGKTTPKKAKKFKKVASPSRKLSTVLEEEPVVKPKRAKIPTKKYTTVPIACVVIRDTPSEFVPKKKTPAKVDRGKGMDLLSNVALLEATLLKKAFKKSKLETHKLHASGSGDGVALLEATLLKKAFKKSKLETYKLHASGSGDGVGVPDVPKYLSKSENESWRDSGSDDDSDEVTKDDDDVDSDADEEEYEVEYVRTPDSFEFTKDDEEYEELYKDVNVRLKEIEHEEEGKRDEEMIDAGRADGTQQTTYEQVNQFLNLDNVSPTDTEVVSMMNVKVSHEEPSTQTPPILNIHVTSIPTPTPTPTTATTTTFITESFENIVMDKSSSQPKSIYEAAASLIEFELKKIILDKIQKITHVKVMKWYIVVQREDQLLYKFKEGDFLRLNLRDIQDLLLVQKKLSNLEKDVIYNLNVALWMFTRCVVILKRVKDLQLGVKSYQKKLNTTKPKTFRVLHDIASSLRMDYMPKRRWTKLDRKWSRIMIKVIDQKLLKEGNPDGRNYWIKISQDS
nr:hypothetical protein [Tanacetum cinerariifolium]